MAPVATRPPPEELIGRDRLLGRLTALVERAAAGEWLTVLVSGEAGIGKTALVRAAVTRAEAQGAQVGWGTCLDVDGAPGYWPWSQVLDGLVRTIGVAPARDLAGDDASLLSTIGASLGRPGPVESSDRVQLLLWDATARWLDALSEAAAVVVVVDDLQWADESSLRLLDFLSRSRPRAAVCVIGAYRHDELSPATRSRIDNVVGRGEHLHVEGIDAGAVGVLVERVTGDPIDADLVQRIYRRTGGHPLFVRELALIPRHADGGGDDLPAAVQDAIERRAGRMSPATLAVLETAALVGVGVVPDVVAGALSVPIVDVEAAAHTALEAGVLTAGGEGRLHFTHDLVRETMLARLDVPQKLQLHQAIGTALEQRLSRGGVVGPAELAHHFTHAVALDGPERACRWALEAADSDCAALAFAEAAGHLRRLRAAVSDAGAVLDDQRLIDVLLAEAGALARAGSTVDARGLLHRARDVADRAGDTTRTARVALATAQLGARFAARRDEIIVELDRTLDLIAGTDSELEALVAATLARELQHSVAEDRPRAGPLSERALRLGRRSGDPVTLTTCLLARHDLLWSPGRGTERAEVAREIVVVAQRAGDDDRQAEGLLLLANALLECGSPAFAAPFESCLAILDRLGQPRHRYTAESRRAFLALLRGDLDDAAERIDAATRLGERIREPDTGNVRMSQLLELIRDRSDPDELRRFAAAAVAHWTGAPIHAHAVAAGFGARAGDLDAARHHVAAVVDLGGWHADRSYLWSVFVRELAVAAVALGDRKLCDRLLRDLEPLAGSCGVNGAVVAFAGSHAHVAGLLAAALDRNDLARTLLGQAGDTYQRLGAPRWASETTRHVEALGSSTDDSPAAASMRRQRDVWHLAFAGRRATVAHVKGLADLAALVVASGRDVHVLDLVDSGDRSSAAGDVVDRRALDAYRQRIIDLDDDITEAENNHDPERVARLHVERQALLDELGRTTGIGRRPRQFASHPAERARKAVTARIREALKKIEAVLPELAAHFELAITTGTYCRYRGDDTITWSIESAAASGAGRDGPPG
jgi:hypothetical protein